MKIFDEVEIDWPVYRPYDEHCRFFVMGFLAPDTALIGVYNPDATLVERIDMHFDFLIKKEEQDDDFADACLGDYFSSAFFCFAIPTADFLSASRLPEDSMLVILYPLRETDEFDRHAFGYKAAVVSSSLVASRVLAVSLFDIDLVDVDNDFIFPSYEKAEALLQDMRSLYLEEAEMASKSLAYRSHLHEYTMTYEYDDDAGIEGMVSVVRSFFPSSDYIIRYHNFSGSFPDFYNFGQ